ncbi:MAG: penicillin-binding transpeptidase domain-containing protein [Bulleidia sp.]|nr:penicillin-binding transpeptidase domain-containing protein [Bulleidia sp.]
MRKNHGRRTIRMIFLLTLAVMTAIATNVFLVSVAKVHWRSGTDLSAYADSANTVKETTKALRGNIYTNDGTIIAEDNRTYNIYCILAKDRIVADKDEIAYVADKEGTAKALAEILKADYDTILSFLKQDVWQTELGNAGRNLSETTKQRIEALNLPGIEFTDSIQRVYPLGQFASNLIGFAQSDETGSTVGKMGLELYLDNYLKGEDGYRIYQADKHGYVLPGMKEEVQSAVNGYNIYTTLDQVIQEALEESFTITVDMFNARRAWGAVMDVHTGKILAWGQYPSFDPNTLEITDYNNYGTQIPYEPGSTLKTITWASAINEGVYNGTDLVDSGPFYYEADKDNNPYRVAYTRQSDPITNASNANYGYIDFDHGLIYSSNVVAATVQTALVTPDIHLSYLKKFGFFQPVATDGLPEQTGKLTFTWPGEKLALSYGQGSTVTMLQMLQAYSAVFTDGTMKKPYYIDSIRDSYDNSIIYQAETKITGNPITADTAKQLQGLLYRTVNDDDGTARADRIPECKVMGKTGTTQVFLNGSYLSGYTIASFMSAIPADNPQVAVYYCFEAPYNRNAHWKTDATKNLLRKTAMRLGFAQNTEEGTEETGEAAVEETQETPAVMGADMPNLVNHTIGYAQSKLSGVDADVLVLGNGSSVIAQYPTEGTYLDNSEKVFLVTDAQSFVLPDMTGWTRKDVTALWQATQFGFKLSGEGVVTEQTPAAGTTVNKGDQIEVTFSS